MGALRGAVTAYAEGHVSRAAGLEKRSEKGLHGGVLRHPPMGDV